MAYLEKGSTSTYGKAYEASSQASKSGAKRFKVKILSPYQLYFQGDAESISAANQSGPFDILAGHANFFSLVDEGKVMVNTGFQRLEFPISGGIIRVNGDGVTLFADV